MERRQSCSYKIKVIVISYITGKKSFIKLQLIVELFMTTILITPDQVLQAGLVFVFDDVIYVALRGFLTRPFLFTSTDQSLIPF